MRSIPAPSEPLADGHITLRLAAERDIPETLIAYQDDLQMHIRLGEERPPSGAQLGRMFEQAGAEMNQGLAVRLTITEPGADDCRGQITIDDFDWENHRAQAKIWVAPQRRGRGFARRSLVLAARWLFDACELRRLALLTPPDNEAMLHAARAAGFVEEGILRGYVRSRNGRLDMAILSLVPEDLGQAPHR
jgi:RimJ/RimL family protein N-acetyltransferase